MHKKKKEKYKDKRLGRKMMEKFINEELFNYQEISPSPNQKKEYIYESQLTKPKNQNQDKYFKLLKNDEVKVILATGPAGTGKTMIPCERAILKLINEEIDKIIITRPVVPADEEIGFLPGGLEEKMAPWMRPIYDMFYKFMHPEKLQKYIVDQKIEIVPLAFMRGRTFKNCFIIADEMQNATCSQTKMILTRIGENSKIIITGDLDQHDRKEKSGLEDFIKRMENYEGNGIKHVQFYKNDIEREVIVRDILKLYD